jgi:hypothetical protein
VDSKLVLWVVLYVVAMISFRKRPEKMVGCTLFFVACFITYKHILNTYKIAISFCGLLIFGVLVFLMCWGMKFINSKSEKSSPQTIQFFPRFITKGD